MVKYAYNRTTKSFEKLPRYIYQRNNGWYEIRKRIGGALVYWGSYPTLEEAKLHLAYYQGMHWKTRPVYRANRHISQRGNTYIVVKNINNERVSFGTFKSLEEARKERDICIACDWEFDRIVEWED